VKFGVAADVFDGDGNFQIVANIADFLRGLGGGRESVWHGKQVVGVTAVNAAPAEMIGEPGSFGALDQAFQAFEMLAIGAVRGAEVHGNAVLHDAILIENLIEDMHRPAAIDHEIFRNDFEPIDYRLAGEDVLVVRGTQTDPDAIFCESVETIGGH